MLVQGTLTKISILRLRPVLAAHVKALKTLKKKKSVKELGFFLILQGLFHLSCVIFYKLQKTAIFSRQILKQPVTEINTREENLLM